VSRSAIPPSPPRPARGFTLLELLVALALFALVAAMSYGGLAAMVRTQEGLRAQGDRLAALQLAVGLLERDLRQAAVRPIRDRMGETLPTLLGQSRALELTTLSPANPLVVSRPNLQRVGYLLDRRRLVRQAYAVLDRAPGTQPAVKTLLEEADDLGIRYLSRDQQWFDAWPPPRPVPSDPLALPRAIEIRLALVGYGTIRRVIALPDAPPARDAGPVPPGGIAPGIVR
jgi:general secretion pathway protein J